MKHKMTMLAVLTLGFITLGALSGCNTAEGFGRDIESAGRSIQNTF